MRIHEGLVLPFFIRTIKLEGHCTLSRTGVHFFSLGLWFKIGAASYLI